VKLALRRCTTSATDPISATESRTAPKRSSPISNVTGSQEKDAVIPREEREDPGGDKHQLVLAFFDTEDAADQAARR